MRRNTVESPGVWTYNCWVLVTSAREGGIVEGKSAFMVVKIRFGRGPVVARRKGKNSRIALLGAGFLTLVSICLASLGSWRFCQDIGIAGDFIFEDGFLSHWQVWIASAALTQYACWRLSRYAKQAREEAVDDDETEDPKSGQTPAGIAANM
jgi:hypothetical protein